MKRISAGTKDATPTADREMVSLTCSRLQARNVRWRVEAGRDLEAERTRVTAGVITAF